MTTINAFVLKHVRILEMIGVLMRIFSFSLVSWLGPAQPIYVRVDIQHRAALNVFWILVGFVGILRGGNFIH